MKLKMTTTARTTRRPTEHTDWCAGPGSHLCGINEHRSPEQIADCAVGGRAVITRVQAGDVQYIEVRARIPLHASPTGSRWQVGEALRWMRALLAAVAIRPGVLSTPNEQPAVSGRKAIGR